MTKHDKSKWQRVQICLDEAEWTGHPSSCSYIERGKHVSFNVAMDCTTCMPAWLIDRVKLVATSGAWLFARAFFWNAKAKSVCRTDCSFMFLLFKEDWDYDGIPWDENKRKRAQDEFHLASRVLHLRKWRKGKYISEVSETSWKFKVARFVAKGTHTQTHLFFLIVWVHYTQSHISHIFYSLADTVWNGMQVSTMGMYWLHRGHE